MTEKNYFDGKLYEEQFRSGHVSLPNAEIDWVSDLRASSIKKYTVAGIPGPKVEEWKYTNLSRLNSQPYGISTPSMAVTDDIIEKLGLGDISGPKVVFTDGYFDSGRSSIGDIPGAEVLSLNDYIRQDAEGAKALFEKNEGRNSLQNLNIALMTGGYVIKVDAGAKLAEPIQIFHIASDLTAAKSLRTKNFIMMAPESEAQIIESFYGGNDQEYWRQNVTSVNLAERASLNISQFQIEGIKAIHMGETDIQLSGNSQLEHFSINLGGQLSRTEVRPTLNGLNANVELRGAFLARDGAAHDVLTHVKHMVPECNSNQIYRGVLGKGGKSAFQGKVYVAKDAQLTSADQSNKNLLLDRNAEANSKPELLIYADDVKCSHGATVGELDQEALFYIQSRGLDEKAAKSLLTEAFIAEVFEDIHVKQIKERYLELARNWLNSGQ